ncbi:SUKH-4 family immunity protein [Metabacillus idriensis]|uniref:SUKH-4 family immunity protein n=1 Tax=Metabacillus idriensis TaxID=324768 RepID=UPI00174E64F6|nr:SUKH-4 family immunity protein [Metabacillus idriensis]
MMSPENFLKNWNTAKDGELIAFNEDGLIIDSISEQTRDFLVNAGLPETPPPYLEFISSNGILLSLIEKFNMPSKFKNYWYLGTTGSGDPVCLNVKDNIVYLNNGDNYNEIFINSSINQFAESILLFNNMIDKAIEVNGEDAFLDNDIPEELITRLKEDLKRIDKKSIDSNSFWRTEIENLQE